MNVLKAATSHTLNRRILWFCELHLNKVAFEKKNLLKNKVKRPPKKVLMFFKMKENKMPRFLPS